MNILALDTSSSACTLALESNGNVHALHEVAPQQQAKLILPMLKQLLEQASLKVSDLDAIAYGCGPGSFTGLRIASSVVQALTVVKKMPILRISSLAILAQAAFDEHNCPRVLVCLDARIGQIYCAAYQANHAGLVELVGEEAAYTPEEIDIPESFIKNTWHGVGEGWAVYEGRLRESLPTVPQAIHFLQFPHAQGLLKLAKIQFEKADYTPTFDAFPVYLR